MKTVLLITTNDEFKKVEFENTLEFYYEQIGCDMIEIVPVRALVQLSEKCEDYVMIVDEESLLKTAPKLNIYASVLYGSPIYGNAVIVKDAGEDFDGLEEEDHAELASAMAELITLLESNYHD